MYLAHFGLNSDPFRLDPNLKYLFVSRGHEEVIAHLVYGLEQGESFVLITGGIGTGKTLALHYLLSQLSAGFHTAFINVTKVDFHELLKMILDDLEIEYVRGGDNADLLRVLRRTLLGIRDRREKLLVVVDEAQDLDADTLEGLRLLSNLCQPGEQALQIVLAGQPGLDTLIKQPHLEQLDQRIRIRYRLQHLAPDEVGPYIAHRLAVAGLDRSPFGDDAVARIVEESRGIPRLVNQLAARGMLGAYVDGDRRVKAVHLDEDEEETALAPDAAPTPVQEPPRSRVTGMGSAESMAAAPPPERAAPPAPEPPPPAPPRPPRAAPPPAWDAAPSRRTPPAAPPPAAPMPTPRPSARAGLRPTPAPLPPPAKMAPPPLLEEPRRPPRFRMEESAAAPASPSAPAPPPAPPAPDSAAANPWSVRRSERETRARRRPGLWALIVWIAVILAVVAVDQWFRSGRSLPFDTGYGFSIPGFDLGSGRFDGGDAVPTPARDGQDPADSTLGGAGAGEAAADSITAPPPESADGSA